MSAAPSLRERLDRVRQRSLAIGGAALLSGYAVAALSGAKRYDADYVAFVQKKQLERIRLGHLWSFLRTVMRSSAARGA